MQPQGNKKQKSYAYNKVRSSSKSKESPRRLTICNRISVLSGFLQHSLCCLDINGNVKLWPLYSEEMQTYLAKYI